MNLTQMPVNPIQALYECSRYWWEESARLWPWKPALVLVETEMEIPDFEFTDHRDLILKEFIRSS